MTDAEVEAVARAITDEVGSQLCAWRNGCERVCRRRMHQDVCFCEDAARAAIAAAEARGCKLVPREPTIDMLAAGQQATTTTVADEAYRVMYDAAPKVQP